MPGDLGRIGVTGKQTSVGLHYLFGTQLIALDQYKFFVIFATSMRF